MRYLIPILGVALIVAAAVAQPQPAPQPQQPPRQAQPAQPAPPAVGMRGGFGGPQREMQTKALEALQQAIAKLKTSMEAMMLPAGTDFQSLSDEDRTKFRDKMMQGREEQAKIITDIESQLPMLKGRRQLQTEHDDSMASLQALQAQAKQENATKTADMIGKMIKEKQTKFDAMMEKMGGPGRGQ